MNPNRNKNLREKYIDGEDLFRKYFEWGDARSTGRLQKYAISRNMKSSTGREPTKMGVWKAMWRWATQHRAEAWEICKDYMDMTEDEWVADMRLKVRAAWQHNSDAKYNKFLREYGWL